MSCGHGPAKAGPHVLLLLLLVFAPSLAHAQQEELSSPRRTAPLTILQINDVYSTLPVNGAGGLARVATIRKQVQQDGRTPLLMLAGDFLAGSVASTVFKGEQMIDALNAAGVDVATLGNHEFDFGVDTLLTRMAEAKFQWVVSNVVDRQTGRPVGGAAPYLIRTAGPLKVGILGLCIRSEGILPATLERLDIVNPVDAVARYLPELKREGANAVVVLTHLRFQEDRELADRFPDIDVIVGGHEHYPITAMWGRTFVSKAGMDGRFVARIDLDKRGTNPVDRYFELIPVTSAIKDDADTLGVVNAWETKLGTAMNNVIGTVSVPLDARDRVLRLGENALGDLIADTMRGHSGADVAIVNSGGIRGNRIYPAGPITQRTLIELHPFSNVICEVAVTGRVLLQALENGASLLPDYANAGRFPQISGFTMKVNLSSPSGSRIHDVRVNGAPLDLDRTYTLALPDFVLEGGDGFTMFAGSRVLIDKENGTPIRDALESAITGKDIAPQVDGRIVVEP
jgi:2',3'-cyclic-nucleotide 2'-phosphodiesterase (5'-nucleotidase family)